MTKTATIKDVAKKAGVSIATVSFVLNKRAGQSISEEVRRRVLRAVRQLDYHPNAAAAGLARKRTHNVAITFYCEQHLIANQFYSFVVQGAIKQAIESEYNLLFTYVDQEYSGVADLPKVIREKNAEGALFMQHVHPQLIKDIQARAIPVVAIDHYPPLKHVNSLQIDNRRGGALAAGHLLELGHRRIGILRGAPERPSIAERAAGFAAAAKAGGAEVTVFDTKYPSFDFGYQKGRQFLARKRRPTALFCVNDELATGVLRAAHELDVAVPDELSLVGFDDITFSSYSNPPITTVSLDKEELGRRAMARLLELVAGGDSAMRQETVPVELLVRGSTAPPG